jgi:hypothetical protein
LHTSGLTEHPNGIIQFVDQVPQHASLGGICRVGNPKISARAPIRKVALGLDTDRVNRADPE